jgi:hypothetical protein
MILKAMPFKCMETNRINKRHGILNTNPMNTIDLGCNTRERLTDLHWVLAKHHADRWTLSSSCLVPVASLECYVQLIIKTNSQQKHVCYTLEIRGQWRRYSMICRFPRGIMLPRKDTLGRKLSIYTLVSKCFK